MFAVVRVEAIQLLMLHADAARNQAAVRVRLKLARPQGIPAELG
jgi:hypothetical protein